MIFIKRKIIRNKIEIFCEIFYKTNCGIDYQFEKEREIDRKQEAKEEEEEEEEEEDRVCCFIISCDRVHDRIFLKYPIYESSYLIFYKKKNKTKNNQQQCGTDSISSNHLINSIN
ncbi:hypothetical protein V1477_002300, partial [Vespula maculifrons]